MLRDEFEAKLRDWREFHLGPPRSSRSLSDDASGPAKNVMARHAQFAPRTKARAQRKLLGRDGTSRRTLMAKGAGVGGMRIVPEHFVDPIVCTETRIGGHPGAYDGLSPQARLLEKAAMDLYRFDTLKGLVFRFEYLTLGPQRDKADQIASIVGAPLPLRMYRQHLEQARFWIMGRIAA